MPQAPTNTRSWSTTPISSSPLSAFLPWAINPRIRLSSWVVRWSRNTEKRFVFFGAISAPPTVESKIFFPEYWELTGQACRPNPLSSTDTVWLGRLPCPEMETYLPPRSSNQKEWLRESCTILPAIAEPRQGFSTSRTSGFPQLMTRRSFRWPRPRNCSELP